MLSMVAMDVTDADSIRKVATQLKNAAIDVIINSAGIAGAPGQSVGQVDYESWFRVSDVNTMGPLRVLESFIDHIAASDRRLVVTITSGMGSLADNTSGGSIAYRSSEAAVNMVMRSAAIDRAARRRLRSCQPRLGQDRHGRARCDAHAAAERDSLATAHRDVRPAAFVPVLSLRWPRVSVVSTERR